MVVYQMRELSVFKIPEANFEFTRRWFESRNLGTFEKFVLPVWKDKPINYLEIGVFEGMSMVWMLYYVLRHPDSRAVGIDPWLIERKKPQDVVDSIMKRAFHNVSVFGNKCELIRANSNVILFEMSRKTGYAGFTCKSVDIALIDGIHTDLGAWQDARFVLPLMKSGGWILFDDVESEKKKGNQHVKAGIKGFLSESGDKVSFKWKSRFMECYEVK